MKNKKILFNILISVLIFLFSTTLLACTDNAKTIEPTKTFNYLKNQPSFINEGDSPIICVNNLNLEMRDDIVNQGFTFNILSKEPLNLDDVNVVLDTDRTFKILEPSSTFTKEKFSLDLYLQYNCIDEVSYRKNNIAIQEEYDSISKDDCPEFYNNEFYLQFDSDKILKDEVILNADFIINGIEYNVDLGNIYFNQMEDTENNDELYGDYDLSFNSVGRFNSRVPFNENGLIYTTDYELNANTDVTIKDILINNQNDEFASVQGATFYTIEDDDSLTPYKSYEPGDTIDIEANTRLFANFLIEDIEFKRTPIEYASNLYFTIKYESGGKNYITKTITSIESINESEELYVMHKDDVDLTDYYIEHTIEPDFFKDF